MAKQNWLRRLLSPQPGQRSIPGVSANSVPPSISVGRGTSAPKNAISEQNTPLPQQQFSSAIEVAELDVPPAWQSGDVILNQYEVTDILGQGGMGIVYKVHHRGWKTDLAVKSPTPGILTKTGGKENFIREAETWVNLDLHPHIVSCYYVRTLGGIPRVFAEYVEGGSLSDWIRMGKLYKGGHGKARERMLDIAIQFAWGLHYAHEQGLVHQDVKPANVMITGNGIAKVTDFGLAMARAMGGDLEAQSGGTQRSVLVSSKGMSRPYCSPEQANRQGLSRKTDIWSWGVSVLEMFVGEVTWLSGVVAREALSVHRPVDPAIPPMPPEIVKLLNWCFQRDIADRPATMLEIATELQTIYTRLVGHPYPREAPKPTEILADSLNNRALSLYDLGKVEEARQVWEQTLKIDPQHLEATYNQGIILWRQGDLTDDMLVDQLEALQSFQKYPWEVAYLLALVHLERGDVKSALSSAEEALHQAPNKEEIINLHQQVQVRKSTYTHVQQVLSQEKVIGDSQSVSLSADGRLALSKTTDFKEEPLGLGAVRLWDTATGQCLHVFKYPSLYHGHENVCLSADGQFALSRAGSKGNPLRLWKTTTSHCLPRLRVPKIDIKRDIEIISVSLSADGRLALSANMHGVVRLWRTSTGRCLRIFKGLGGFVDLSADGQVALISGVDAMWGRYNGSLQLWETATGRCLRAFDTDQVELALLSADGHLALSYGSNGTQLWETATGQCLCTFKLRCRLLSLSADGRWALGMGNRGVQLWETSTGRCFRTFWRAPFYSYHDIDFSFRPPATMSSDGRLVLVSKSGILHLWENRVDGSLFCPLRLSPVFSSSDVIQTDIQAEKLLGEVEQAYTERRFPEALASLQRAQALPGWRFAPKILERCT